MSAAQMIAHEHELGRLPPQKEVQEAFNRVLAEQEEYAAMKAMPCAQGILHEAAGTIAERGVQRDSAEQGERSMARCVAAFNGLTGRDLTEKEGWFFMVALKMARSMNGKTPRRDDYVDGSAYFSLAGESVLKTPKPYAGPA